MEKLIDQSSNLQESNEKFRYVVFNQLESREYLIKVADNFIDQLRESGSKYDYFIFLDRSARLAARLIKERWKHRFPEEENNIPRIKFVNIGRERQVQGKYPLENESDEIELLRNSFSKDNENSLDESKVIIVDEFAFSGGTLKHAKSLFQSAFPEIELDIAALTEPNPDDVIQLNSPTTNKEREQMAELSLKIKPLDDKMPISLGDSFGGLKLPTPPSEEVNGSFFIKPDRNNPEKLERYNQAVKEVCEFTHSD